MLKPINIIDEIKKYTYDIPIEYWYKGENYMGYVSKLAGTRVARAISKAVLYGSKATSTEELINHIDSNENIYPSYIKGLVNYKTDKYGTFIDGKLNNGLPRCNSNLSGIYNVNKYKIKTNGMVYFKAYEGTKETKVEAYAYADFGLI